MSKYTVVATWDDAAHLSPSVKASLLASIPENQRDARSKGIPHLGAGLIYTISEEAVRIRDFFIPTHWKRAWAFDTGWNWNAAVLGALDPETDIGYITAVYKREKAEPPINAAAILSWGRWIPGVADAADINRLDGRQYLQMYKDLGLDVELPNKAIETGIMRVWTALSTGKLKVFESCGPWFDEYRIYSRNSKGVIPEHQDDHLMDCTKFLVTSGWDRAKAPPQIHLENEYDWDARPSEYSWMH